MAPGERSGRGVVIVGAPEGRLQPLAEPLAQALKAIGAPSAIEWWSPSALANDEIDAERIARTLVDALVVAFDVDNGLDLAAYLLGAREALSRNPSLLVYSGERPAWRLAAFQQNWVCVDDVGTPDFLNDLTRLLQARAPTSTNRLVRLHANGFRALGIVSARLRQRELEPSGVQKVRSKRTPVETRGAAAKPAERRFGLWRLAGDEAMPIVGVTFGDITQVRGVPAWVNSENVDMQMARVVDASISARIRARGARYTGAHGQSDDAMFVDLAREMGARATIPPGDVLLTWARPGSRLYDDNGVRLVAHVASVEPRGEAQGYAAVADLSHCLLRAIIALEERFDREKVRPSRPIADETWPDPAMVTHAILSPLLGAGDGGVSAMASAHMMAEALRQWSVRYRDRERKEPGPDAHIAVHRVYLLAREQGARDAIEAAFAGHGFMPLDAEEGPAR
ncbi:MAG: hypothetical protein GC206_16695 [Alphaproteobacteria bacterium]|nr:hypothetical protein [Alphaproteobacteria bacterium]